MIRFQYFKVRIEDHSSSFKEIGQSLAMIFDHCSCESIETYEDNPILHLNILRKEGLEIVLFSKRSLFFWMG
jgi:hypothetical protein